MGRPKTPPRKCGECGKEFHPRRQAQRFCGTQCSLVATHKSKIGQRWPQIHKGKCEECQKPFLSRKSGTRFCSHACNHQAIDRKRLEERLDKRAMRTFACPHCNEEVTTPHGDQQFCSHRCNRLFNSAATRAARNAKRPPIKCRTCRMFFRTDRRWAKFCSTKCRTASLSRDGRPDHSAKPILTASEKRRKNNLKTWYGLSWEEYLALLKKQGHKCAICKTPLDGGKNTHVDHDHECDDGVYKIRGVLCGRCNTGLGCFKDDTLRMTAAIAYLESYKPSKKPRRVMRN